MDNLDKWNIFEKTGKISDYLSYRGITATNEKGKDDYSKGNCSQTTKCGGE